MDNRASTDNQLRQELESLRKKVKELESVVEENKRTEQDLRKSDEEWQGVQKALKESEKKFRSIIHASPMGVHMYLLNPNDQLIFVGANPSADRILGVDNTQFIGKSIEEAFPPLAGTEVPKRYRQAATDGTPWNTSQVNYEHDRIAGAYEVYAFQTSPGRMACMFLDITERLRAEKALRESEIRYRRLFETMAQGVVYQDLDGNIVAANPAAETILGLKLSDLLNRRSNDSRWRTIHEDGSELPGESHPSMIALRTGSTKRAIMGVYNPMDDSHRWIDVHATPEFAEGETAPCGVYTTFTDITERKEAEEKRRKLEQQLRHAQKMEAVGRLAGGIAHDFNNLLTTMGGYSELILQQLPDDHDLRSDVMEIRDAAERAASLTQQLLTFSRKQIISPKILDLNASIDASHRMLSRLIGEDVELRVHVHDQPVAVKADPGQIDQVLMNLAVNARDAMPDGGRLVVSTEKVTLDHEFCRDNPSLTPGDFAVLSVEDSGCGMDEETASQIFEPFFTTKERGKGTGLGMSTVFGIVQQNNGVVKVHSQPGTGTTIKIFLPLAKEAAITADVLEETRALTGTETILLAEDDAAVRALTEKFLVRWGYTVLSVESEDDCESLCREYDGDIHLFLTDVVMPKLNGREIYEKLVKIRPALKALYMSGYTGNIITKHGILDKDTTFIQKPFTIQELAHKVRQALDRAG